MSRVVKSIGRAYHRARGHYPARIHGMKFKVDPDHIKFWKKAADGRWEPHTYRILSRFIGADAVYCDLGAWIGPTVIYAARRCRQVVCVEPDPVAYEYLCRNVELNGLRNVSSFDIALAESAGMRRLSSFGERLGDSRASLLAEGDDTEGVNVQTLTWAEFIELAGIEKIDVLKIDIEGGEFALVPTLENYLSRHRPIVYLSTHPHLLDAGLRQEQMRRIMNVLGMYKQCLNEELEPVDIHEAVSEPAVNSGRSFLFLD